MRARALGAVLVVAAALLDGSAAAASLRPRMLGGAPDTTHEAVVALVDGAGRTVCSGTLVAPRAVLTAAHCLPFDAGEPLSFERACIGDSAERCVESIAVIASLRHPAYRPGVFHHDLAVVTLAAEARAAPAPLATEAPPVGSAVVLVGFGRTDAADGTTTGERRARTVTVTSREEERIRYGEATCTGDSGGGAFVAGELVAVTSSGPADCRDFGDSQLVAPERSFIESAAGIAADPGGGCTTGPMGAARSPRRSWALLVLCCLVVVRRFRAPKLSRRDRATYRELAHPLCVGRGRARGAGMPKKRRGPGAVAPRLVPVLLAGVVAACQLGSAPSSELPDGHPGDSTSDGAPAALVDGGPGATLEDGAVDAMGDGPAEPADGAFPADGSASTSDAAACPSSPPTPVSYDLPDGVCTTTGDFCEMSVLPLAATLTRAWGSSMTDVWMTGAGAVVHWDGARWRGRLGVQGMSAEPLIAGSSPNDLWFGGVLRWSGATLAKAAQPAPGHSTGMWFASANDGWSVNGSNDAYHWDGAIWSASPTGAVAGVKAVHGFAPNDVWAVGGPSIRHWDGVAWGDAPVPLPAGQTANVIGGASPDDFWVAGSALFHYAGGTWTTHTTPKSVVSIKANSITDVTFVDRADKRVWQWNGSLSQNMSATQSCIACGGCTDVAKWPGGSVYSAQFSPSSALSCPAIGLTRRSPQLSTGQTVDHGGKAMTLAGGKLSVHGENGTELWGATVDDVAVGLSQWGPDDIWVTGYYDTLNMASHHDGVSWSTTSLPARPTSSVGAASATSAWVLMGSQPAYWDGATWTVRGSAAPEWDGAKWIGPTPVRAIWGSSATDAWAVGRGGMRHWDGAAWSVVPGLPSSLDFTEVRGSSASDVIARSSGALHRWNGVSWTKIVTASFTSAAILAPNDAWIVLSNGTVPAVQHWDGSCWTPYAWQEGAFSAGTEIGGSPQNLWFKSMYQSYHRKTP